jgi:hypothetical protein
MLQGSAGSKQSRRADWTVDSTVLSICWNAVRRHVPPLPLFYVKVFKRNVLGPDLQCKSLIL